MNMYQDGSASAIYKLAYQAVANCSTTLYYKKIQTLNFYILYLFTDLDAKEAMQLYYTKWQIPLPVEVATLRIWSHRYTLRE